MLSELREMLSEEPDRLTFEGVLRIFTYNTGHDDFEVALDYAEQHLESWPDKHRHLNYTHDDYRHLAAPWARLVRYLEFNTDDSRKRANVDGLAQVLAETPHLSRLLGVEFGFRPIGDSGATLIAKSPYMSNLTMLGLACCRIGPHGITAIAESPYMANLQRLNLWGNYVGEVGAKSLAGSPYMSNLQWLRLNGNALGAPVGTDAIINSPYLREEVRSQYLQESMGMMAEAVYSTSDVELLGR